MASKRGLRRRSCGDKVRYATQADAAAAVAAISRRVSRSWVALHAYKCPFGQHFHVGHPPERVRQAIAARR